MKRFKLGAFGEELYEGLTPEERAAWINPERFSYHSFHVERMGEDKYYWRDSRQGFFYTGTLAELLGALEQMRRRKLDPVYEQHVTAMRILSQEEIDKLFDDL